MIIRSDARYIPLADESVDCCVTSPPFWGLRDYGVDGQLGLEKTLQEYVDNMVSVFREVRRVLRSEGTLWLNLGDSYATNRGSNGGSRVNEGVKQKTNRGHLRRWMPLPAGLKDKDLCGIPWRVALALQDDGWWLRSDVIWSKPNPMPESVQDRPTRSHEYLFLLTKSERYYYDAAAVSEPSICDRVRGTHGYSHVPGDGDNSGLSRRENTAMRNKRSVWEIPLQPFNGAHFATFPEKLVEPCIAAGCPEGGLVLDPFAGSGTVGEVAYKMGRRFVLCDIKYQELQRDRIPPMEFTYAPSGVSS